MWRRMGAPVAAGLAASLLVAAAELIAWGSGGIPGVVAISDFLACSSFVWCGVIAWRRRPASRTGPLLMLGGLGLAPVNLVFVGDSEVLRTIGLMGLQTFAAPLVHVLLGFPSGRVTEPRYRAVVVAAYLHLTLQWWIMLVFYEPPPDCLTCLQGNALGLLAEREVWDVLKVVHASLNGVFSVILLRTLIQRYRAATPAGRRDLTPLLVAGAIVAIIASATAPFAYQMIDGTLPPTSLQALWSFAWWILPITVLTAALRTRASRVRLGELVERLARRPAPLGLRAALADALEDPSLELGFWVPEVNGWRDADGRPLREQTTPRAVTELVRDGRPQAILVFDPALLEDDEALESVRAAASVAIDTERLQAELRVQLAEVRAAQARVVDAADAGRRSIERDLRAGPQRRLLDLGATLAMIDAALPRSRRDDLMPLVTASQELTGRVRDELRDLAAGVFPAALQRGGLAEALRELAVLSPLPVELVLDVGDEPPPAVAVAAWFACREAIANAAKHAGATAVQIVAEVRDGELWVSISDDGAGGADASGSGLRGLADRMAALGGRLTVDSVAGAGTRLQVALPIGVPA